MHPRASHLLLCLFNHVQNRSISAVSLRPRSPTGLQPPQGFLKELVNEMLVARALNASGEGCVDRIVF
eukprot:6207586-Pleurochrysis_carterae.AAC.2